MGAGIAQVLLEAGVRVTLAESSDEAAAAARARVEEGLRKSKADEAEALSRLVTVSELVGPLDVDLAVEAVPEDPGLKAVVLASIEAAVSAETVIATNTSSLSVDG